MKRIVKLDLKNSEYGEYITQCQRKYFNLALDFAMENNMRIVIVKGIEYHFNFRKLEVTIRSGRDYPIPYKLKRCK